MQLPIPALKANAIHSPVDIEYLTLSITLTESNKTNYRQQLKVIAEALLEVLKKTCIPKPLKTMLAQHEQRHLDLAH